MTLETFILIVNVQTSLFAIGYVISLIKFKARQLYIKLLGFTLLASVCGDLSFGLLRALKLPGNYGGSIYSIVDFPLVSLIYFYATGQKHFNIFFLLHYFKLRFLS